MTTLEDIVQWPETLPLPSLDYNGTPNHVTITSRVESPRILRRSRYTSAGVSVFLQWIFTLGQYEAFEAFFITDLNLGGSLFRLVLHYPFASDLTEWRVRFTSGYDATYVDGSWMVTASLDLVRPFEIPAPSPITGRTNFLVAPEEGTLFIVVSDLIYVVKV